MARAVPVPHGRSAARAPAARVKEPGPRQALRRPAARTTARSAAGRWFRARPLPPAATPRPSPAGAARLIPAGAARPAASAAGGPAPPGTAGWPRTRRCEATLHGPSPSPADRRPAALPVPRSGGAGAPAPPSRDCPGCSRTTARSKRLALPHCPLPLTSTHRRVPTAPGWSREATSNCSGPVRWKQRVRSQPILSHTVGAAGPHIAASLALADPGRNGGAEHIARERTEGPVRPLGSGATHPARSPRNRRAGAAPHRA